MQLLTLHVQSHGEVAEQEVAKGHSHEHSDEDWTIVGHHGQHQEIAEHCLEQEYERLLAELDEALTWSRILENHPRWWSGCI